MRTVTETKTVYAFDELPEGVRARIIELEIDFLSSLPDGERPQYIDDAIAECERLRTPWFECQAAWEKGKEEIESGLKEREFYITGAEYYI